MDMTNFQVLIRLLQTLTKNFKTIGSITVDINIINVLKTIPESKQVLIFCGTNHAVRISKLWLDPPDLIIDDNGKVVYDFLTSHIERANAFPISSPIDIEIFAYFSK